MDLQGLQDHCLDCGVRVLSLLDLEDLESTYTITSCGHSFLFEGAPEFLGVYMRNLGSGTLLLDWKLLSLVLYFHRPC